MVRVRTNIDASDGAWTVSVQGIENPILYWWKRYADKETAHIEAAQLGLVEQQKTPSGNTFSLNVKTFSQGDAAIDVAALQRAGFDRRPVQFRWTTLGKANFSGDMRDSFEVLPAPGTVFSPAQTGLDRPHTLTGIGVIFIPGGPVQIIFEIRR